MYLYQEVSFTDFCELFRLYNRANDFSYEAKRVLYDALLGIAEEQQTPMEVDIIAICGEYCEIRKDEVSSETEAKGLEELYDHTWVLGETDDTVIYEIY